MNIKLSSVAAGFALAVFAPVLAFAPIASAATDNTIVINGDAQGNWLFNRDLTTSTPYEFNEDQATIGDGSLYVLPIENNNASGIEGNAPAKDKFIAENFLAKPVADVQSISYDFLIAGNGQPSDEDDFYLNVYANVDNTDKYYDCRYDYVPATGSTTEFTKATFATTDTPTRVATSGSTRVEGGTCPATLAGMPEGSYIRVFAINLGQSNATDQGLGGYFDNVQVATTDGTTSYDFEENQPAAAVPAGLQWTNPAVACGGDTGSYTITADWEEAANAVKYRYAVNTPTTYTDPAAPYTTEVTATERAGEFNDGEGEYTFRVAAQNADGVWSDYSEACSITYTKPLPVSAASKDECKNGGWMNFQTDYKNQGDCVSSVASQGKAKGNPKAEAEPSVSERVSNVFARWFR